MKAVILLLIFLPSQTSSQEEAEHLSWELGKPDNTVETVVICDPYLQDGQSLSESDSPTLYHYSLKPEPSEHIDW